MPTKREMLREFMNLVEEDQEVHVQENDADSTEAYVDALMMVLLATPAAAVKKLLARQRAHVDEARWEQERWRADKEDQ